MSLRTLGLVLLLAGTAHAQTVWYVDADATGANTGTSWADAFPDLQDALAAAEVGDEVWVAEGTYRPTSGTDRTASFGLPGGVRLFGGFAGTEAQRHERDWAAHETVLSGDIGVQGQAGDNSYHVVRAEGVGAGTLLDGFVVEAGNANGNSEPLGDAGGGLFLRDASPTLQNLVVRRNAAPNGAGLMARDGSGPLVVNGLFYGNLAGGDGGGAAVVNGSLTILASTVTDNVASEGGAIYTSNSVVIIRNAILWNNGGEEITRTASSVTVDHSIVEGGFAGTVVLDLDPAFVDPTGADYRLGDASPARDVGITSALPPDRFDLDGDGDTTEPLPVDLAVAERVVGGSPDLGAYEVESAETCPSSSVIFVDADATGTGSGSSWLDAFPSLYRAFGIARDCAFVGEFWVAEGTYTPVDLNPDAPFAVQSGWAVYGGFDGTETTRDERDWVAHPTILSGRIGSASSSDDVQNLVLIVEASPETRLDGFIVERSRSSGLLNRGGDPSLVHLTFSAHSGDALRNEDGSPHLDALTFETNQVLRVEGGAPSITASRFVDGAMLVHAGGSASVSTSSFELSDVTVTAGSPSFTAIESILPGSIFSSFIRVEGGTPVFNGVLGPRWRLVVSAGSARFQDASFSANRGLAVAIDGGEAVFLDAHIDDNSRGSEGFVYGAGVRITDGVATFVNTTFEANRLSSSNFKDYAVANGAGVHIGGGEAFFYNCLFANNTAMASGKFGSDAYGAGLLAYAPVVVVNSTFTGNRVSASHTGGSALAAYEGLTLYNTIAWGNEGAEPITVDDEPTVIVEHAIIEGGFPGGVDILDQDPLFESEEDFHLQPGSPAIDFGLASFLPPDTFDLDGDGDTAEPLPLDLDGGPRVLGTSVDLGAYESPFTVAADPQPEIPTVFRLVGAYPNPFNPAARVAFDLPEAAEVELAVFDVLGRRVRTVGPVGLAAGAARSLVLDGRGLASGLYLYRLTARMGETTQTASGSVTLLR